MIYVFNKLTNSGVYINQTHIILVDVVIPFEDYKVVLINNNKVIVNDDDFERIKKEL